MEAGNREATAADRDGNARCGLNSQYAARVGDHQGAAPGGRAGFAGKVDLGTMPDFAKIDCGQFLLAGFQMMMRVWQQETADSGQAC